MDSEALANIKLFKTSDVRATVISDRESLNSLSGRVYLSLEHVPSKTMIAGWVGTLNQKEKRRLYKYLERLVNETWADAIN